MTSCLYCSDQGKIGGCPNCHLIKSVGPVAVAKANLEADITTRGMGELDNQFLGSKLQSFKVGVTVEARLSAYATTLDAIVSNAKSGVVPSRSIVVSSPSEFGKTVFLRTIRFAYQSNALRLARVRTLEEFQLNYNNLMLGKDKALNFLDDFTSSDLVVLSVLNPSSTSLKQTVGSLLNLAEKYETPVLLCCSANLQNILPNTSTLHDNSLCFKHPIAVAYW